jgi:hypothetical protein
VNDQEVKAISSDARSRSGERGAVSTRGRVIGLAMAVFAVVAVSSRSASAQLATFHPCVGSPASNEVRVYVNANSGTPCAALYVGFYPFSGNQAGGFGVANDSISSVLVGSGVRLRIFSDGEFGGNYRILTSGYYPGMPPDWNDTVSSIRVENAARSATCNDLQPGEYSLFRDPGFAGDCVVLRWGVGYNTAHEMGIANDSVSGILGGPTPPNSCQPGLTAHWNVQLFVNSPPVGQSFEFGPGANVSALSIYNFDNVTSSLSSAVVCL